MRPGETPRARIAAAAAALAAAGILGVCARRVERVTVKGTSMVPTLLPGDRLLIWRGAPCRAGDLVVASGAGQDAGTVVKRVAAVGHGLIALVGDNPPASTDSRDYGPVALSAVRGRAVYRYAPAERVGWLTRSGGAC